MKKLEELLEWDGTTKKVTFFIISAVAFLTDIFNLLPLPFDAAWIAIILCGIPILLEVVIGLIRSRQTLIRR